LNAQKFTQKSLEALQSAQNLAIEYQNVQIEQQHLVYTLLTQENGLIGQLLKKMEIDLSAMLPAVRAEIEKLSRMSGPGREEGKIYISQEVDRALVEAEKTAERMKDDYVSVEHVMLALLDSPNSAMKQVFAS
jgi:ATP-dependent Clp protease ATP-binding subunit ClpB